MEVLVLTGPECCGKTTLAEALGRRWSAPCVPEVARTWLADKPGYQQADLLAIAQSQQQAETEILGQSPPIVVCDTDLLVIIIWSEVKYGNCDPWIVKTFEDNQQHSATQRCYCLCDYHLPWQADPLRENPDNRDKLFELYRQKLEHYQLNYCIAAGTTEQRMQQITRCPGLQK